MPDSQFISTAPAAPLDVAVEMILYAKGPIPGEAEKILPHGKVALGISVGGPHRFGKHPTGKDDRSFQPGWFTGLQTSPLYHRPPPTTDVHGIIFDPLAFSEMFPQNMAAWRDTTVSSLDVVGHGFGRRLLGLCRQQSVVDAIHQSIVELLLVRWRQREAHPVWLWQGYRRICELQGRVRLEELYRRLDVSGRHFNNAFQAATGVSPKGLCRVLRLNSVLAIVDPGRELNWSHLAHATGYSDQSHFNRDFKHFTGMTPRQYVYARQAGYDQLQPGEDVNFVPEID